MGLIKERMWIGQWLFQVVNCLRAAVIKGLKLLCIFNSLQCFRLLKSPNMHIYARNCAIFSFSYGVVTIFLLCFLWNCSMLWYLCCNVTWCDTFKALSRLKENAHDVEITHDRFWYVCVCSNAFFLVPMRLTITLRQLLGDRWGLTPDFSNTTLLSNKVSFFILFFMYVCLFQSCACQGARFQIILQHVSIRLSGLTHGSHVWLWCTNKTEF